MMVRCRFLYHKQLTALSQYNTLLFSPRLLAKRSTICATIRKFFAETIIPKLAVGGFDSFVIDFALVGAEHDRVMVIELNPFQPATDACLFSWKQERALLEGAAARSGSSAAAPATAVAASSLFGLVDCCTTDSAVENPAPDPVSKPQSHEGGSGGDGGGSSSSSSASFEFRLLKSPHKEMHLLVSRDWRHLLTAAAPEPSPEPV